MQEEYDALLASTQYKEFIEQHEKHMLVNAFILYSDQYDATWQFGFYAEDTDLITAFVIRGNQDDGFEIEQQKADEVTKEPSAKLLPLNLDVVQKTSEQALEIAITFIEVEYNAGAAQSKILLLQNMAELGEVWNVTIISKTFDVMNVKVNAKNGEVVSHSQHSLLDMQANKG